MGAVADFIDDIVDVITDIADGIWAAIEKIADWLEDQLGWINVALIVLVVLSLGIMLPEAIAAYEGAMLSAVIAYGPTLAGIDLIVAQAASIAIGLKAGFGAFLTAIHFDVILRIHQIAYLISPHYREMFQKVLNEIMNISQILGLGPAFIVLALENARTLVLTVSGLFGMKYDLAQIQWIAIMNNYLKEFAKQAERYKNNPGLLLIDMSDLIYRPIMDQMGEYMQTLIKTIEDTIENAEELAKAVVKISKELDDFIDDLPQFLKDAITPYTTPIIKTFDDFVRINYTPHMKKLQGVLTVLSSRQRGIKSTVDTTIDRLLYPGNYLHEIDALDPDLENEQAWSLAEVTTRPDRELFELVKEEGKTISNELQTVLKILRTRLPRPSYDLPRIPAPVVIPQIEMKSYNTWFVGDY